MIRADIIDATSIQVGKINLASQCSGVDIVASWQPTETKIDIKWACIYCEGVNPDEKFKCIHCDAPRKVTCKIVT